MKRTLFSMVLATIALVACGGGDDAFQTPGTGNGGTPPPTTGPSVSAVTLQTSSPQLASNGSTPVEITAFVRGADNQFLTDIPVSFQASSGGLAITQATTDQNGMAKATLNPAGDPTNRTIQVTATAGATSETIAVDVIGTQLNLSGPSSLVQGDQASYTIILTDSGGQGISNRSVTISSQNGNTLSGTSVNTDSTGRASVTLTASNAGADTLTATALGITAERSLTVSNDSFAFTAPATNTEIPLNQNAMVTVTWTAGANPLSGETIHFSTTRGVLSSTTAVTDGSGQASVTISSSNAGGAVITASADNGGVSTQLPVEFVAQTPASIDVQASPATIATGAQSTITAIVRDAQNNLVKNRIVTFQLQDVTGGTLSVGSAVTDSQGRAQTVYTASTTTSANDGVLITATVQGFGAVTATAPLTVAQSAVFLSLGTGNEISEPNTAEYIIEYAVHATDSAGNGVDGVNVQLSLKSLAYIAGKRTRATSSDPWTVTANDICRDEDVLNQNGILDPGEDVNGSTRLEAGNVALVTPGSIVTSGGGLGLVTVRYPQDHAGYVLVELTAKSTVQGTETTRSTKFVLPMSAEDAKSDSPPGPVSPFGETDPACTAYPTPF